MSDKQLIIGFGTGRSGTTSLSAFLNTQDRVRILHEGRMENTIPGKPFAWKDDEVQVLQWIEEVLTQDDGCDWVGDIGMYYINYVDTLLNHYPGVRFICMQRSCEEVVRSYMEWTVGKNHWMVHDGSTWSHDERWDKAYPKFDTQNKEEALRMYWTSYSQQTSELQARHPEHVKVVNLSEFNNRQCRADILDFIQYTGVRHLDDIIATNSLKRRKRRRQMKQFSRAFWTLKRSLLGSPGKRWFI